MVAFVARANWALLFGTFVVMRGRICYSNIPTFWELLVWWLTHIVGRNICSGQIYTNWWCFVKWLIDTFLVGARANTRWGPSLISLSRQRSQTQNIRLGHNFTCFISSGHTNVSTILTLGTVLKIRILLILIFVLISRCRFLNRLSIIPGTNFCWGRCYTIKFLFTNSLLIVAIGVNGLLAYTWAAWDALSVILRLVLRTSVFNLTEKKLSSLLDLLFLFRQLGLNNLLGNLCRLRIQIEIGGLA